MKYIVSQMTFFMGQQSNKQNMRFVARFLMLILFLIVLYSSLFIAIMHYEGREYSIITGYYWTLTVMSTLGFGDITFESDIGKAFTILVLLSGVLLFMLVMPITFIRFVYTPWLEAQNKARIPREVPESVHDHVIVIGADSVTLSIVERLRQYAIRYKLLVPEGPKADELFEKGYDLVTGETDTACTYNKLHVEKASLVVALHNDLKNTNICSTVREVCKSVPIAASANNEESVDILTLAGCTHPLYFTRMLGEALARRVFGAGTISNIIGRFENLCIAETPASGTPYVGMTLAETDIRKRFGLNVVGIWQGKEYKPAMAATVIDANSALLLSGTADLLDEYDRQLGGGDIITESPILILGGGRVGKAVADALEKRRIPFRLVEKNPTHVPQHDPRFVLGSAADIDILREAGIDNTQTVIITTHNDDLNIYLTLYCRKLRPEIQIISRSTLDRNVGSLYSAGANLVMSHATMAANTVVNLLSPDRAFMLTEGLNIFRVKVPPVLVGVSLRESTIRVDTQCNVVAVRSPEGLHITPDPNAPLRQDDEMIIIGTIEAEQRFMLRYPVNSQ